LLAVSQAHALDAMSLGEDMGRALGQRLFLARAVGYAGIVLLCGAATAAAGPIGFVGLMVPHMVRLIVGPHWRWILAYAMLAGPVLVLGADVLGRVIARPDEIEAGIVTAVLGAPVLLALVLRRGETPR
jgi:iron complex transport system permease protein